MADLTAIRYTSMARLYGNDEDFWTSDDDDDTSSETQEVEEVEEVERPRVDALAAVYEAMIGADTNENGHSFVEGRGAIAAETIVAPTKKSIRKTWVIHDSLPTDNFEEEIPDPAMRSVLLGSGVNY